MFSFINIPAKILTFLEFNISPNEVALGVCLGMFFGFTPLNGPMALLFLILFFLLKVNRISTALILPLFKLFYVFGASQLADRLGSYLLIDATFLNNFWRTVTNLPILALLDFNNTLVTGGLALSLICFLPVFLLAKFIYIKLIQPKLKIIQNTKVAKVLTKSKVASKIVVNMDKIRSKTE